MTNAVAKINFVMMLLVMTSFGACVSRDREESQLKSSEDSAGGCNLAKMEKASNESSKKAFECAYNSLITAGKLSGGVVTDVAEIIEGIKDFTEGALAATEYFSDIGEYIKNRGKEPAGDEATQPKSETGDKVGDANAAVKNTKKNIEKTSAGKKLVRSAMYRCLGGQFDAVSELYRLSHTLKGVGNGTVTAQQIKALAFVGFDQVLLVLNQMNTLAECSDWLSGTRTKDMVKLSTGVKKIAKIIKAYRVVADCGVDLAQGGYVLFNNTSCLSGDMYSYYESRKQLESQRDKYVKNTPIPHREPRSGKASCMAKYGIFLQMQTFYTYMSTSTKCGEYCGNSDSGNQYLKDNLARIYTREDDLAWCSANVLEAKDFDAVRLCAVYCCDQETAAPTQPW